MLNYSGVLDALDASILIMDTIFVYKCIEKAGNWNTYVLYKYAYYWAMSLITRAQYSPQCIIMQNTGTTDYAFLARQTSSPH